MEEAKKKYANTTKSSSIKRGPNKSDKKKLESKTNNSVASKKNNKMNKKDSNEKKDITYNKKKPYKKKVNNTEKQYSDTKYKAKSNKKNVDKKNITNKGNNNSSKKAAEVEAKLELPKKKSNYKDKKYTKKVDKKLDEFDLPKLKIESTDKPLKESEEELIITRQLDINLEEYTYNHVGLVEKVKAVLDEEKEESLLEDPFESEQLFSEIFEDSNKSFFQRLFGRKNKKEKRNK